MPSQTLSKILRVSPAILDSYETILKEQTGKEDGLARLEEENRILVDRTLEEFGMNRQSNAEDIYEALIDRLKHTDDHLFEFLGKPDLAKMSNVCGKLCEAAIGLNQPQNGYFIKKEKAISMLEQFPPQNLLTHFGYGNVREMVDKEGFSSVFSALRFAQDQKWMHEFFDKAYDDLTIDDFEERPVELKVLEHQWLEIAEKFLQKKYHNVSHLKELGVIFVIPLAIDTPGETLRLFTLILHYLNEVPFYSRLFRKFASEPDFNTKLKSLLRGDVSDQQRPDENNLRIVQRYLAKDDTNDFRLLEPHINPEAEHWFKAEGDLGKLAQYAELKGHAFAYWQGLDFVGDFFKNKDGNEVLVSFDLIDLVMSLVVRGEVKYLYHQEEALWNRIFVEFFGREKMNELVEQSIIGGFIKL